MKCAIYARYSSDLQRETSIDDQFRRCEEFAAKQGWEIVDRFADRAISGEAVRICGSVNGQIKGTTVTLAKTAKVVGDVLHQTLSIEPGAFFEGQCRRIDSSQVGHDRASSSKKESAGSTSSHSAAAE